MQRTRFLLVFALFSLVWGSAYALIDGEEILTFANGKATIIYDRSFVNVRDGLVAAETEGTVHAKVPWYHSEREDFELLVGEDFVKKVGAAFDQYIELNTKNPSKLANAFLFVASLPKITSTGLLVSDVQATLKGLIKTDVIPADVLNKTKELLVQTIPTIREPTVTTARLLATLIRWETDIYLQIDAATKLRWIQETTGEQWIAFHDLIREQEKITRTEFALAAYALQGIEFSEIYATIYQYELTVELAKKLVTFARGLKKSDGRTYEKAHYVVSETIRNCIDHLDMTDNETSHMLSLLGEMRDFNPGAQDLLWDMLKSNNPTLQAGGIHGSLNRMLASRFKYDVYDAMIWVDILNLIYEGEPSQEMIEAYIEFVPELVAAEKESYERALPLLESYLESIPVVDQMNKFRLVASILKMIRMIDPGEQIVLSALVMAEVVVKQGFLSKEEANEILNHYKEKNYFVDNMLNGVNNETAFQKIVQIRSKRQVLVDWTNRYVLRQKSGPRMITTKQVQGLAKEIRIKL